MFSEKRKVLRKVSGVEPEVLRAKSWGSDEIIARSQRLARRAYDDVWDF